MERRIRKRQQSTKIIAILKNYSKLPHACFDISITCSSDVVLFEENFLEILPNDERFQKVRVVLYNASCSKSGVTSAIDYVLQEGTSCVHDLVNGVESNKLRGLVIKYQEIIRHAMKFFFVHYIVYSTSSIYKSENEDVIKKVIDDHHSEGVNKSHFNPFLVTSFLPDLTEKLRMFKANPAEEADPSLNACMFLIFHNSP